MKRVKVPPNNPKENPTVKNIYKIYMPSKMGTDQRVKGGVLTRRGWLG
jgi:hypothetical protein